MFVMSVAFDLFHNYLWVYFLPVVSLANNYRIFLFPFIIQSVHFKTVSTTYVVEPKP